MLNSICSSPRRQKGRGVTIIIASIILLSPRCVPIARLYSHRFLQNNNNTNDNFMQLGRTTTKKVRNVSLRFSTDCTDCIDRYNNKSKRTKSTIKTPPTFRHFSLLLYSSDFSRVDVYFDVFDKKKKKKEPLK